MMVNTYDEPTRYEVAVEAADGLRRLVCYTPRRSRHGLSNCIRRDNFLKHYEDSYVRRAGKAADGLVIETPDGTKLARVFFTGRTQRDVLNGGSTPLPYLAG